jgi:CBS-domain-containing membrane protein
MQPIASATIIAADVPLLEAIEQLETKQVNALSVTDRDGMLIGLLEKAAVINLLHRQPQTTPA